MQFLAEKTAAAAWQEQELQERFKRLENRFRFGFVVGFPPLVRANSNRNIYSDNKNDGDKLFVVLMLELRT